MWEAKQDHGTVGACGEPSDEDGKKKKKRQHFSVGFLFVLMLAVSHLSKKASLRRIKWGFLVEEPFLVRFDGEVCKTQMAQTGQQQLDLLKGKKGSLKFTFLFLCTLMTNSHLCALIPRLFRILFLPGELEEGKATTLMAVSCN